MTPDGQHIISSSEDDIVKFWTVASNSMRGSCNHRGVEAFAAMEGSPRVVLGTLWQMDKACALVV